MVTVREPRKSFVRKANRLIHGINGHVTEGETLLLAKPFYRVYTLVINSADLGIFSIVEHWHVLLASPAPENLHDFDSSLKSIPSLP